MKYLTFLLSTFLVINLGFATTTLADSKVIELDPVSTWIQARNRCLALGDNWDLPTVTDIQENKISTSKYNRVYYRDIKTQSLKSYFLVWTRSNEDELNQQFVRVSQALKLDLETGEIDSFNMSNARSVHMGIYLDQLEANKEKMTRSESDHTRLLRFLEAYHASDFGLQFPIDIDVPLSEQPEYVIMIPTAILPAEVLLILSKPSQRYVDTIIDNVELELEAISDGLGVICVQGQDF